jgi:hypothetical protein
VGFLGEGGDVMEELVINRISDARFSIGRRNGREVVKNFVKGCRINGYAQMLLIVLIAHLQCLLVEASFHFLSKERQYHTHRFKKPRIKLLRSKNLVTIGVIAGVIINPTIKMMIEISKI